MPSRGFAHLQGSDGERRFSIMRVVDTTRLPQVKERESVCVCVCVRERECVCERESVCV